MEDKFYRDAASPPHCLLVMLMFRVLKVLNLGVPTLMYGVAGLLMTRHTEVVSVNGKLITIYFWYKENRGSPN